jgi:hypothetical protein
MGRPDATNHEPQHRTNLIRLPANGSQAIDPPPPTRAASAKRRRLARAKQRALVTSELMWHVAKTQYGSTSPLSGLPDPHQANNSITISLAIKARDNPVDNASN